MIKTTYILILIVKIINKIIMNNYNNVNSKIIVIKNRKKLNCELSILS